MSVSTLFFLQPARLRRFVGALAASALMSLTLGCSNSTENIPDVSGIRITLHTNRFDKDFYDIDTNNIAGGLRKLKEKYPDFLNYYLDTISKYNIRGNFSDTVAGIREQLKTELTNKDFRDLENEIKNQYPDARHPDDELAEGFRFVKLYIPSYVIPNIYYLNMGLSNWPTFPVDNQNLCVGLDMFLGEHYPHYKDVGVPSYMYTHCRKEYLPVSLFHSVYQTMHPFSQDDKTLLDLMIQRGKEQYFLHRILPRTPDSTIFGFTQVQVKWCNDNESLIYNFFIHQNLLFSKVGQNVLPYVYDGPFAKDMEASSDPVKYTPGNVGTWLGYRIVCAWMAEHPKTTLAELLSGTTDAARFLEEARYRPK